MKKLLVLGAGCAKCELLARLTRQAADDLGLEYELTKVTDLRQMTALGVMMTPALVVDGEVKVSGKVPNVQQLKKLLS